MSSQHSRLAGETHGSDSAPAVVLLHPVCTSREIWRLQVPVWSKSFRLILIDLPGHGLSKALGGAPQLFDFVHALRSTLDADGVDKIALVGVSLGAMVAQAFALTYPERTKALVLANSGAHTPAPVKALWDERLLDYGNLGAENHVRSTLERWFSESYRTRAPLTVKWVEDQISGTSRDGYFEAVAAIKGMNHVSSLPSISVPTLVIAGERDAAVKPEICAGIAGSIPGSRYAVLPGGHISNVECAAEFTELVGEFLLKS